MNISGGLNEVMAHFCDEAIRYKGIRRERRRRRLIMSAKKEGGKVRMRWCAYKEGKQVRGC